MAWFKMKYPRLIHKSLFLFPLLGENSPSKKTCSHAPVKSLAKVDSWGKGDDHLHMTNQQMTAKLPLLNLGLNRNTRILLARSVKDSMPAKEARIIGTGMVLGT